MIRKVERVEISKDFFVVSAPSSGDRDEMKNVAKAIMEDSEIDKIFDLFDGCGLSKEAIELADKALVNADPTKLKSVIVIAFLSASLSVRKLLPSRSAFYERARTHFAATRPTEVDALLRGLE